MSDNDVRIVVDAENRTQKAFGAAERGAKKVGDTAEKAGEQVKKMGDKVEAAAIKARKLAEAEERSAAKTRDMIAKLQQLRQQMERSGDSSGALGRRIERLTIDIKASANATDDYRRAANRAASEARDQARAYDRVAANARQAARAVATLGAAAAVTGGGRAGGGGAAAAPQQSGGGGFWDKLTENAGDAATKPFGAAGALGALASNPYGAGLGMAGFVTTAPFLGSVVGGGMLAGAGAGVAALGFAGAYQNDPEGFHRKWTSIIDSVKSRWVSSSAAWVEPAQRAMDRFKQTADNLPIEDLLKSTSRYGDLLSEAGAGFVARGQSGFLAFLKSAGPVLEELAVEVPELGEDFGDMFRAIGIGSKGGAAALGDMLDIIGGLAEGFGKVVLGAEHLYLSQRNIVNDLRQWEASVPVLGEVAGKFEEIRNKVLGVDPPLQQAGRMLNGLGSDAEGVAEDIAGIGFAFEELQEKIWRSKDASLDLAQGWIDLKEELKDGKKTLDTNTQAGIDNQRALLAQMEAAKRVRDEQIALTNDVAAADATYKQNIERIRQMAIAAGFNADQVNRLIAELQAVDGQHVNATVGVAGVSEAIASVTRLGGRLNDIAGVYYATVRVRQDRPFDGLERRASGGPSSAKMTMVNDWGAHGGGEIISLPNGSTVIPAGTGRAMMRDLAGSGRGGAPIVLEIRSSGQAFDDFLVDRLASAVRVRGGNVQIAVTGRAA